MNYSILNYISEESLETVLRTLTCCMDETELLDDSTISWENFSLVAGGLTQSSLEKDKQPVLLCGMRLSNILQDVHFRYSNAANGSVGATWENLSDMVARSIDHCKEELLRCRYVDDVQMYPQHFSNERPSGSHEAVTYLYFRMVFKFDLIECVDIGLAATDEDRKRILDRLRGDTRHHSRVV